MRTKQNKPETRITPAVLYNGMFRCYDCLPDGVGMDSDGVYPIKAQNKFEYPVRCEICDKVHAYMRLENQKLSDGIKKEIEKVEEEIAELEDQRDTLEIEDYEPYQDSFNDWLDEVSIVEIPGVNLSASDILLEMDETEYHYQLQQYVSEFPIEETAEYEALNEKIEELEDKKSDLEEKLEEAEEEEMNAELQQQFPMVFN